MCCCQILLWTLKCSQRNRGHEWILLVFFGLNCIERSGIWPSVNKAFHSLICFLALSGWSSCRGIATARRKNGCTTSSVGHSETAPNRPNSAEAEVWFISGEKITVKWQLWTMCHKPTTIFMFLSLKTVHFMPISAFQMVLMVK